MESANPKLALKPGMPRHLLAAIAMGITLAITVVIIWLFMWLHPLPPHTITMATGPEGSAFAELGERYKQALAKDGILLTLVSTGGGAENLAQLNDPRSGVQVGFVEGGLTTPAESPTLVSLGTLSYEPLWLFTRGVPLDKGFAGLRGKRLSLGQLGSAGRAISAELIKRNAYSVQGITVLSLTPQEASQELLRGRLDAAVIMTSWESPAVQELLRSDAVDMVGFPRVDAYVALYPFLTKLTVPMGAGDLANNRPPHDVQLIATRSSLIARHDLHPALQYLLLESASQIHAGAGIFHKPGQFPAAETLDIPLSRHARHYFKAGRPLLQRYLPFWMAVLAEQFLVLLIPLVGVLYPLIKGMAALYGWGMQRRIILLYGELWFFENQMEAAAPDSREELLERLKLLEKRANKLRVSAPYIPMLYSLKNHIEIVLERLERPQP